MSNAVKIYDTTLRDGTQGEGISFSVTDKLLIAEKLDHFGVDYIEGGFPGSNPRDITFFHEAQKLKLSHARLAAFGATLWFGGMDAIYLWKASWDAAPAGTIGPTSGRRGSRCSRSS